MTWFPLGGVPAFWCHHARRLLFYTVYCINTANTLLVPYPPHLSLNVFLHRSSSLAVLNEHFDKLLSPLFRVKDLGMIQVVPPQNL